MQVIVKRLYSPLIIIVSLIIPAGVFVAAFIFLFFMCKIARKKAKKSMPPPLPRYRAYLNPTLTVDTLDRPRTRTIPTVSSVGGESGERLSQRTTRRL